MRSTATRWTTTRLIVAALVLTGFTSGADGPGREVSAGQVEKVSPEEIGGGREPQVSDRGD